MDIQKLRYFHTVAKYEHITKAAEELHIAQPSLTQAIHLLESELETPLLVRNGRGVSLTEAGIYLKERLDTLLPEFDRLPKEINMLKGRMSKTVRLNILAASSFVINAVMEYRSQHPDIIFDFEQNERHDDCDITITTGGLYDPNTNLKRKREVIKERIYLAVPKDSLYANAEKINLSELKNESFIMLSSARLFGEICNGFCSSAGFKPKILFESDAPGAVQNIIETGAGIAFWPEHSWGKINNPSIKLIPIGDLDCYRYLIFKLQKNATYSKYAEDFYNFLIRRLS